MSADLCRAKLMIEAAEEAMGGRIDPKAAGVRTPLTGNDAVRNWLRLAREQIEVNELLDEAKRRGICVEWTSLGVKKLLPFTMIRTLIAQDKENDKTGRRIEP